MKFLLYLKSAYLYLRFHKEIESYWWCCIKYGYSFDEDAPWHDKLRLWQRAD